MPTISVIVPVYKVEPYLHRCVDSILNQTYTDFELILVDDGSPDGCPAICDEYAAKDSRVIVIHQPNGGVSHARNAGLDIAQGEYIAFVDSDDYIHTQMLNVSYRQAIETGLDLVSFGFHLISQRDAAPNGGGSLHTIVFGNADDRKNYLLEKAQHKRGSWSAWAFLFKTKMIQDNAIRFCTMCNNFAEDMGFVLNCLTCTNGIAEIDDRLYYYEDARETSMMNKSRGICRLNDVNEVARSVEPYYMRCFGHDGFCLIHHAIITNQLIFARGAKHLKLAVNSVSAKDFFHQYCKEFFLSTNGQSIPNKHFPYDYLRRCYDRFLFDENYSRLIIDEIVAWPFLHFRRILRRMSKCLRN